MNIGKYVLVYYAALFTAFGIAGLVAPDLVTSLIGYSLDGPIAQMEFMATYGGLFLGVGAFMFYCIKQHVYTGLVSVLLTMGAMLITRLIGYFSFGEIDTVQSVYFAGEIFTVILVGYVLFKNGHELQHSKAVNTGQTTPQSS